jgi:hypothetical protein
MCATPPIVGSHVTLNASSVLHSETGKMVQGVKVTTIDGHDVGWIRETHKAHILAYIDQTLRINGLIVHCTTFIWYGDVCYNATVVWIPYVRISVVVDSDNMLTYIFYHHQGHPSGVSDTE